MRSSNRIDNLNCNNKCEYIDIILVISIDILTDILTWL